MKRGAGILLMVGGLLGAASGPALASPVFYLNPDTVPSGTTVAAYGRGFCADPRCSSVTLTLDSQTLASGVKVAADGSFSASVRIVGAIGTYTVLATQTQADGAKLQVPAGVAVAAADAAVQPSPRPAGTVQPPASQPPPAVAKSPPASPAPAATTAAPALAASPPASPALSPPAGQSPAGALPPQEPASGHLHLGSVALMAAAVAAIALATALVVRGRRRTPHS